MHESISERISRYSLIGGLLLLLALLVTATPAFPQAAPDATVAAALHNLGDRAGMVFAGEVTAIRPLGGVVEVDFRVDQSLKGPAAGSIALREWTGLWAAGQRRYWIGERAVFFFNQPGQNGLSSPVDGMEGILPLANDATSVDVQRLRARVVRAAGAPMVASSGSMSLAAVTTAAVGDPSGAPVRLPILKPRPILPRSHPARPISTLLEPLDATS